MKRTLTMLSLLLLSACVTGGDPALTRIEPGMSQAEVASILGEPVTRLSLEDGDEFWDYMRVGVRFSERDRVEVITGRENAGAPTAP
jgi:outer membrane protein assembly factor BamE (lipoprotein component of BamABCDE complex)